MDKINKETSVCKCHLFVVSCSAASQPLSPTLSYTCTQTARNTTGKACAMHLLEIPAPCIYRASKPLPVDTALPSFSSKRAAVSLHHPQPPGKKMSGKGAGDGGWGANMFTGVMPPASKPGHDDNLNDDDDKDDDREECCHTEHLTPVSWQESNIWPPQKEDKSISCAIICES